MRAAVIINPVSGFRRWRAGGRRVEEAMVVLRAEGVEPEVFLTTHPGHAYELAAAAVARGIALVYAWGGDGTVNEVACALAFRDVELAIVPTGSGNGLARALGVPRRAAAALRHALAARPRRIDVGEIAGRLFFNVAGVGFDAHVAHRFSLQGGRRGLRRYIAVATRELFTYEPRLCRVSVGTGVHEQRAFLLTIANGPQWGNGALVAPGARLDDGLLDLVAVAPLSRLQLVRAVPRLFDGTVTRVPGVSIQRVEEVRVTGEPPMLFHVDGEPGIAPGPELLVRVRPAGLIVRA